MIISNGKRQSNAKALLDTGNTVKTKCVISQKLHKALGGTITKPFTTTIGTAKEGAKLTPVGISSPLKLRIKGIKRNFVLKPLVMKDLSDDINLGSGFLTKLGRQTECKLVYDGGNPRLKIGKESVELIRQIKETAATEPVPAIQSAPTLEELLTKLKINENVVLQEQPEVKKKLINLLDKYRDVFASSTRVTGTTTLIEFDIVLKQGAKPVKQKVRPLNPEQRDSLRKQLDLWLKEGVIRESNSPWASALVPTPKKCGGTRWAVDYRALNQFTIADAWPLPNIEENLERLQGSCIFSTLDASAAYHTIPVSSRAQEYLTFITPFGTYTFMKMPFGAKNSCSVYSRFVEMLLSQNRSQGTLAYLDDVIAHNKNAEEHLDELEKILILHRKAGIKLKAEKTSLFTEEVEYLGYLVNKEGVNMRKSYVEKVTNWPSPTNTKELNQFLGFVNYYRSFIPNFSKLTNEMNAMRKLSDFQWTAELEGKFEKLKNEFKTEPVRAYPDYFADDPFEVAVDFSKTNIAAVLSQKQGGQERFIAAIGRKTTKYEANYHSCKGELAAIVYALRKWEHILRYRKFILHTDHRSLTYLSSMKKLTGIYFRWLSELQSYDFEIRHRPGKENGNADGLSRSNHITEEPTKEEEEEEAGFIHRLDETNQHLTIPAIIQAQREDEVLCRVRRWVARNRGPTRKELEGGTEELRVYAQQFEVLKIIQDMLYRVVRIHGREFQQICIPLKLVEKVFYWAHEHPTAGHFGFIGTMGKCRARFFFPSMRRTLEQLVKTCDVCLAKTQVAKQREVTHIPRRAGYPGEYLYVDLVGPLPTTQRQSRYILTAEDGFTRFCIAVGIPNKEAATVTNALLERYITVFGVPAKIHSDQGKEFTAAVFTDLLDRLQVKRSTTPPYNPQSNGHVERFHRTLNSLFRVYLDREDSEWERMLPAAMMAYNTKIHSSTGMTPYYAMFLREARLPVDLVVPPPEKEEHVHHQVQTTLQRFRDMYHRVRSKEEGVIKRNAKLYTGSITDFPIGAEVYYLAPRKLPGKPNKITDSWVGPYSIIKKPTEVLVEIAPVDHEGPTLTTHLSRITLCRRRGLTKNRLPRRLSIQDQGDEEAEELNQNLGTEVPGRIGVPVHFINEGSSRIVDKPPGHSEDEPRLIEEDEQMEEADKSRNEREEEGKTTDTIEEDLPAMPTTTTEKNGGEKREAESSADESKTTKTYRLRPKRSRWELLEELQRGKKRNRQTDTEPEKQRKRFPLLPDEISRQLPSSTDTSDMDKIGKIGYITIGVAAGSTLPRRGTAGSAAYDVTCNKAVVIGAGKTARIDVNLYIKLPDDHFMLLLSRSGLAAKGLLVVGGVIDPDYRGSIEVILHNTNQTDFRISKGQRIAQAVFLPVLACKFELFERGEEDEKDNPHLGFGSTD